jgi:hypothetical protein
MISDVPAATGFKDLDSFSREFVRGGENVGPIVSCLDAEGDDRWMLQQEQLIGDRARLPLRYE